MKKHVMSIAYEPKLDAVVNNVCHQTIRLKEVSVGDEIEFNFPENSIYQDITKTVTVSQVIKNQISKEGLGVIQTCGTPGTIYPWDHWFCDRVAELDFIVPATGIELFKVLSRYYDLSEPKLCYVIRWKS